MVGLLRWCLNDILRLATKRTRRKSHHRTWRHRRPYTCRLVGFRAIGRSSKPIKAFRYLHHTERPPNCRHYRPKPFGPSTSSRILSHNHAGPSHQSGARQAPSLLQQHMMESSKHASVLSRLGQVSSRAMVRILTALPFQGLAQADEKES
jgi:hypothetical protein